MIYKIIISGQEYECSIIKHALIDSIYSGSCHQPSDENRHYFDYNFCWRGVWEGRIYFTDKEYWSEDISLINQIWIILENKLKEIIRESDPSIKLSYE
jgi:hypothetical protein